MPNRLPTNESLAPVPQGSRWGRLVAGGYLVIAFVAAALVARDLAMGTPGVGTRIASIITAPWSFFLAGLARALAPVLPLGALRAAGMGAMAFAVALNARILYGMAARFERDARLARGEDAASTPRDAGGRDDG